MNDLVEREFLSILFLKPEIAYDLIKIKPIYLSNELNKLLFEAALESKKKLGVIDISFVAEYSSKIDLTKFTEIITDEYVPLQDVRKHFIYYQIQILDNHKKNVVNSLTKKLNLGQITMQEYLKKMEKINEINIEFASKILTREEIIEGINIQKSKIELSNFPKLNSLLELVQGDFLVVGASTGSGKSGLLLNFLNNLMGKYQCIYFNMEMSKTTIYKRLVAIRAGVTVKSVSNIETDYQKKLIDNAINEIVNSKVIIEHQATYIDEIENVLKTRKNDAKHTIIFLDHIGLIRSNSRIKSIYEQTTDIVKGLRQLCLKYDCTIFAAAQLNRSSYNNSEMNISMLKDSGEIENSASKVILLYREKGFSSDCIEPEMILDIVKNRDGLNGQVKCVYTKTNQIYKEKEYGC